MKMIGKILAMLGLTAAVIMAAASVPASEPAPEAAEEAADKTESYENIGLRLSETQEMDEAKGLFFPYALGALDDSHTVYGLTFIYIAMPKEEARQVLSSGMTSPEELEAFYALQGMIGTLFATDADLDRVRGIYEEMLATVPADFDNVTETGTAGGYTFYYVPAGDTDAYLSAVDEEYAEEFRALEESLPEALKNSEYCEPVDPIKETKGQKFSFTTTDLDGNTVTSEELFAQNEITMLNCWGTWCGFCAAEMPELARIHTRMQEKGCGIVGLEWENDPSEEVFQKARTMMEEWGTNYPNVLMPAELLAKVEGFPTSFFVDREGTVLSVPISGALVDQYETVLDSLLLEDRPAPETAADGEDSSAAEEAVSVEEGASAEEAVSVEEGASAEEAVSVEEGVSAGEAAAAEEAAAVYRIHVADENGPVEGVLIQFCDDTTCRFAQTDENGAAEFDADARAVYEVHVLQVPEGYAADDTVYHTEAAPGEVNILLEKAA